MKDIYILAFETSCDDTSVAIVKNGNTVIANAISSQIDVHAVYGGVVPEIASRKHIEQIDIVLDEALKEAGMSIQEIDGIAVTNAPGLIGALLVGVSYAKALAFSLNKPLIAVHHIEGHIYANLLDNESFKPPFGCLVVSGGHTHITLVKDYCKLEILGGTHDDAAGEVFDKVARALGLGYPGGPHIDKLAKDGNTDAIQFPRAFFGDNSLDFSFSGLKSAVLGYLNKSKMTGDEICVPDVCACFQKAVTDVLVDKTVKAAKMYGITKIAMAGGVCCNSFLRSRMSAECNKNGLELNIPKPVYCTDNAAMIGARAYYDYINNNLADWSLNACATKDLRRL